MRWRAFLILTVGLLLAAQPQKDAKIKKEREKLQGVWKVVKAEVNGKKIPIQAYQNVEIVIEEDQINFKQGGTAYDEIKFELDPSKKPKTIDLEHTGKTLKGKKELGIYELSGDDLKICHAHYSNDKRANEFVTTEGRGWTLYVLKRDKR